MAKNFASALLAGVTVLAFSPSAEAWWGWAWQPSYYRSYYAPAYYYPAYPVCPTFVAMPMALPTKKNADPVPAAATKEPLPLKNAPLKAPTVTESRSGNSSTERLVDRCKVGFWNMTGRDVMLTTDGQQRVLPKDRAVTLELGRDFHWQIDQGASIAEHVPQEQVFHEVVLRQ